MVFETVPTARFHGVVVLTTTNRGLANNLAHRAHTHGERQVLIHNCRLEFEHCEVTKRFRLMALNEHDLDTRDRPEQDRILSDTDTIRFIEHTDAASTPIYAHRWHPTTQGRLRTHPLHSWWQPHRPPWQ
jgi:hypothetical protein